MTPTPTISKTPSERFKLNKELVDGYLGIISSPIYQQSVDFGLLEFVNDLADTVKDGNSAAAAGFKLAGAIAVLNSIRDLSRIPEIKKPAPIKNLNFNA